MEHENSNVIVDVDTELLSSDSQAIFVQYASAIAASNDIKVMYNCQPYHPQRLNVPPDSLMSFYLVKFRGQVDGSACMALMSSPGVGVFDIDDALTYGHYFGSLTEAINILGDNQRVSQVDGSYIFSYWERHEELSELFMPWGKEEIELWESR